MNRNKWIALVILALLMIIALGVGVYFLQKEVPTQKTLSQTEADKLATEIAEAEQFEFACLQLPGPTECYEGINFTNRKNELEAQLNQGGYRYQFGKAVKMA